MKILLSIRHLAVNWLKIEMSSIGWVKTPPTRPRYEKMGKRN